MKWKLNLPEPKMVVYYFVKLLGLAPFTLKGNRFYPPTLLYTVYAMSVALIWICCSAYSIIWLIDLIFRDGDIRTDNLIVIIHSPIRSINLFVTFLLPWLMYKNIVDIMNNSCIIDRDLTNLGIEEDLNKYFKKLLVTTVIANVGLGVIGIVYCYLEITLPIILAIQFAFEFWLQLNAILIFCQMLLFMKQRFKLVNKILYNEFKPAVCIPCPSQLRTIGVSRNSRGRNQAGIVNFTKLQCLRKIEELHLECTEMVDRVNDLFAIQNLVQCLRFTIELMAYCFWIYQRHELSDMLDSNIESLTFQTVGNLVRIILITVELFCIAHASGGTCREGNATRTVLFEVWYESKPRELVDEFYMFALQMLHKPVAVSAFGFFDLGYSLLSRSFCTVVAYVIVMIQFDKSQPNPGI